MIPNKIIEALGGKENIVEVTNCMTRLRPVVRDSNNVKWDELKIVDGVLRVLDANTSTPMIVVGPGKAASLCKEINEILNPKPTEEELDKKTVTPKGAIIKKKRAKGFLRLISQIFVPIIPLLAGTGLLFGIYNIVFASMAAAGWTVDAINNQIPMVVFKIVSSMFFNLLCVAISTQACEIAGGNKFLGMVVGGIISFTVTFFEAGKFANPELFKLGEYSFKLFESGRGGAFAAIAAGLLVGYADKWLKKRLPDALSIHFPALISVGVVGTLTLFVIQPVAGLISYILGICLKWFFELKIPLGGNYGFHFGYLFIAIPYLSLVMLGIHHAIKPIEMEYINRQQPSPITTITDMGGAGQIGASLGLLARYGKKNKRLRETTTKALPVACLGIGEPMIYGVTLPLGRSFLWSSLGAGVGAIVLGFFPTFGARTIDCNGLLGILVDINPLAYVVSFLAAVGGGFLFAFFFGVKKSNLREYEKGILTPEQIAKLPTFISTPVKGDLSSISNVSNGFLIKPRFATLLPNYRVNAPVTGQVVSFNKSDKSVIIRSVSGVEVKVLVYVNEKALKVVPSVGDEIMEGQALYRIAKKEVGSAISNAQVLVKLNNDQLFKNISNNIKPGFNKSETDVITVLANYY